MLLFADSVCIWISRVLAPAATNSVEIWDYPQKTTTKLAN